MKPNDQQLLEEAYEVTRLHSVFLQEGFTEQMLHWGIELFRKKFPNLSQALDQAVAEYQKNNNVEQAGEIFAAALSSNQDQTPANEGLIQNVWDKAKEAATPYIQSAKGLLGSPQDLLKIFHPVTFLQVLQKLAKDAVIAANNKLKKAVRGEMGVKDYVTAPASLAKGLTMDVVIYNILLHGLKRYEEKHGQNMSPEEKEQLKSSKKEFGKEIRGKGDSAINPSPKKIGQFAANAISQVSDYAGLGNHAQYAAG